MLVQKGGVVNTQLWYKGVEGGVWTNKGPLFNVEKSNAVHCFPFLVLVMLMVMVMVMMTNNDDEQ